MPDAQLLAMAAELRELTDETGQAAHHQRPRRHRGHRRGRRRAPGPERPAHRRGAAAAAARGHRRAQHAQHRAGPRGRQRGRRLHLRRPDVPHARPRTAPSAGVGTARRRPPRRSPCRSCAIGGINADNAAPAGRHGRKLRRRQLGRLLRRRPPGRRGGNQKIADVLIALVYNVATKLIATEHTACPA